MCIILPYKPSAFPKSLWYLDTKYLVKIGERGPLPSVIGNLGGVLTLYYTINCSKNTHNKKCELFTFYFDAYFVL